MVDASIKITSAEMGLIGALNIVSADCQRLMLKGCEQAAPTQINTVRN